MELAEKYDKMKDRMINRFEIAEKSEKLIRGSQDEHLKIFIKSIMNAILSNYEDDKTYFDLIYVLGEFVYEMGDYGRSFQIWTNVDLGMLSDFNSGTKEDVEKLEEILNYYSK